MRRQLIAVAMLLMGAAAPALADELDSSRGDDRVVVVNAAPKIGSIGQIARLRRVLESRNMLVKLSAPLEATLDGRNALIADLDAIKGAYANADYDQALTIIEADEERILDEAVGRDPIPALSELSQWRGMIAIKLNQRDEAMRWFRATYRFNPAWAPDKRQISPSMRTIMKRAKTETNEMGTLRIDADPEAARVSIDGAEAKPINDKLTLPVGMHLVMITAENRRPYAELVDIRLSETFKIDINLDQESTLDRAARLVDATAAAPAGKPRLKRATALAKLTGHPRLLFVEDGGDDHVLVRLYDVDSKKVSKPLELVGNADSAAIAQKIVAALDPDNMVDVNTVIVTRSDPGTPSRWYHKWYVWAAIGSVAAVGGYVGYWYLTRQPESVEGF